MSSSLKNLSEYSKETFRDISSKSFGIVISTYYSEITEALYNGAIKTLLAEGAEPSNIVRKDVPGTFELTFGAQLLAQKDEIDAVICIGCVIQGETRHFDFICHAVANGITEVSLKYNKPVIFGVLTPNNQKQALARAGGTLGNKGVEAAIAAINMVTF